MKILKNLGYTVNFIVIDAPSENTKQELWRRIKLLSTKSSISKINKILALRQAIIILKLADKIDARAYYLAGYEINKGECKRLLNECRINAYSCNGADAIQKVLIEYLRKLNNVKIDKERAPIKVILIGEIYSMIEPFTNIFIEEKLMDYGISTTRWMTPSWWIKDLILKPLQLNSLDIKYASKYFIRILKQIG